MLAHSHENVERSRNPIDRGAPRSRSMVRGNPRLFISDELAASPTCAASCLQQERKDCRRVVALWRFADQKTLARKDRARLCVEKREKRSKPRPWAPSRTKPGRAFVRLTGQQVTPTTEPSDPRLPLVEVFSPDLFNPCRIAVRRCFDTGRNGFLDFVFADAARSLNAAFETVKLLQTDLADASWT